MKIVTSNCERSFLSTVCGKNGPGVRLDGRGQYDGRSVEVVFGVEHGCCIVMLGNTRVLAQVSCDISQPKQSRPTEGTLQVYLELSPMGAPNFESGKMSDEGVENARLLERCIRDSRCIDLESLCIVSGEKAWNIRVDVTVLNHDGNLLECSSIATISALAHFRRPDVTVVGTDVTVHSIDDHKPIPLILHHMPVVVTMAVYDEGEFVLIDPIELEERVAEGRVVIGVNAHQEICLSHLSGGLLLTKEKILQCTELAVRRAQVITQAIRSAIDDNQYKQNVNEPVGFVSLLKTGTILGAKHYTPLKKMVVEVPKPVEIVEDGIDGEQEVEKSPTYNVEPSDIIHRVENFLSNATETAVFEGGASKWDIENEEEEEEGEVGSSDSLEEGEIKQEKISASSDSESEDEAGVLQSDQVDVKEEDSGISRGWYNRSAFF